MNRQCLYSKKLSELREKFHNECLHIRNCLYLVNTDDFELAFRNATEEERNAITFDIEVIKDFIDKQLISGDAFENMSITKLRNIGKYWQIDNWWTKSKITLIEDIKNVAERIKENSKRKSIQSESA